MNNRPQTYLRLRHTLIQLHNKLLAPTINKIFFHQLITHTKNFSQLQWLGKPIWQNILDLWTIQETIHQTKPNLIIETGTNQGGSAYYYAQLFDLMQHNGKIITIDTQKLHNLQHPKITYTIGNSTDPKIYKPIQQQAQQTKGPILIILDSDHTQQHVQQELQIYAPLTTIHSYCLIQDASIDQQFIFRRGRPGPLPAIQNYLKQNPQFEIDHQRCNRFLITHSPQGWLRRRH